MSFSGSRLSHRAVPPLPHCTRSDKCHGKAARRYLRLPQCATAPKRATFWYYRAMDTFVIRPLLIEQDDHVRAAWLSLLRNAGLTPETGLDTVLGIFSDQTLIATGARVHNVIKLVAVAPEHRGGPVFNALLDALFKDAFLNGEDKLFVYTKPDSAYAFEAIGFRKLVEADHAVALLERGQPDLAHYLDLLKKAKRDASQTGAIVMHANPFTLGHLHLIETALQTCDLVYVFVLSEHRSPFSPEVRQSLVEQGTSHLKNVLVLPTHDYMVSSATFPTYFLGGPDEAIDAQARLDATLFKTFIVPTLVITHRFVGEEPYSHATKRYNEQLRRVFAGVPELVEIPRLEHAGDPISASRVRRLLAAGDLDAIRFLVPPTTYDFLATRRTT